MMAEERSVNGLAPTCGEASYLYSRASEKVSSRKPSEKWCAIVLGVLTLPSALLATKGA
jgi:hypothetical protein